MFAWAVAKADRLESMAWYSGVLDLTLNTEMELHRQYAARFGLSTADLEAEPMWPTTRAYTDFLVRTAARWGHARSPGRPSSLCLGVRLPGPEAGRRGSSGDQRYADWIAQYASEEFADALDWLRAEMDRLSEGIGEEKADQVKDIFLISTRYEGLFWDMCWNGESWKD